MKKGKSDKPSVPNIPHVIPPVIKANMATHRPAARPTPPEALPPEVVNERKDFPKIDPKKYIEDHPKLGA
jgi:hypothetical protein